MIIGICVDSQNIIYVSEYLKAHIVQWPSNATNLTAIAGNGTSGSSAELLNVSRHIDFDTNGEYLYIADSGNNRIQMWHVLSNGSVPAAADVTVAGGNGADVRSNKLNGPRAVAVSYKNGAIYASDSLNHRVQRCAMNANYGVTIAGSPSGLSSTSASLLSNSTGLVLDANETHLFVCNTGNHYVQRFRFI
ncbi:unnamed protein product [Rotaria sp. Silwood1]|nr:unnamed protein product [Rotaria sp. Silwood1]CAF1473422.1 unnamed protein product [Rotaria sp. Silwood1]CAF3677617.1 unnamed protein product [Rotaria sp. Silwood1]CAF4843348.1 unnamed protein product [Rotaria sp. Silwood1]